MQTFRRSWRIGLVALAAMVGGASLAQAGLTFDVRARSVSGPGVTMTDSKHIGVNGIGGKIIFDVWATITGADANLTNDRLQLYSFRLKSNGPGSAGNLYADNLVNDQTGPINGWEAGAGATSGTMADLDGDGDLDIGAADAVFANGTTGNANGRNLAPAAYNGGGAAAEFNVYSFELPITTLRGGNMNVTLERSPVATAFLWREDAPSGFNKNGNSGTVAVNPAAVEVAVIPEPGTIALAVFGLAGVALAIRRRRS
jgi:hypothetical protein